MRAGRRPAGARVWTILSLGLLLLGVGGCDRGPKPDANVLTLLDRSFQPFRRDFEASRDKVRLVALMSPTCGECLEAMKEISRLILPAVDSPDLEVFCVWVSNVPPDVEVRARTQAERYREPRMHHYWDDSGRIGRAFARQAGLPDGDCLYDVFYLYGRGDSWDPSGTMASEPAGWNALANGWVPGAPRARFGDHPHIRMPTFAHLAVIDRLNSLLATPGSEARE